MLLGMHVKKGRFPSISCAFADLQSACDEGFFSLMLFGMLEMRLLGIDLIVGGIG